MRTLFARLDNIGDVLLTGPAVRAVAAAGRSVTFLAGSRGAAAAELLPGVDHVLVFDAPWVAFDAPAVDEQAIANVVELVARADVDDALIATSFHQSPLPLALLLRLAGVPRIAATCVDYPGRLLDIRHPYRPELHEVEQTLSLCEAAGYPLPACDDGQLRISLPAATPEAVPGEPYVVVHPGASVPARALPTRTAAEVVAALSRRRRVVVTGSADEADLAVRVAAGANPANVDVASGSLDLAELATLLAGADAVVCGNTGVAHLAAAVGTPVVEAFAPVVPPHRWHPWKVPHTLLGTLDIACAGCRARRCPIEGQPCLAPFDVASVLDAVERLAPERLGR